MLAGIVVIACQSPRSWSWRSSSGRGWSSSGPHKLCGPSRLARRARQRRASCPLVGAEHHTRTHHDDLAALADRITAIASVDLSGFTPFLAQLPFYVNENLWPTITLMVSLAAILLTLLVIVREHNVTAKIGRVFPPWRYAREPVATCPCQYQGSQGLTGDPLPGIRDSCVALIVVECTSEQTVPATAQTLKTPSQKVEPCRPTPAAPQRRRRVRRRTGRGRRPYSLTAPDGCACIRLRSGWEVWAGRGARPARWAHPPCRRRACRC